MKFLKKFFLNKKGSEVVEKILLTVASVALVSIGITLIVSKINEAGKKTYTPSGTAGSQTITEP